jgi:hypothetical protein
MKTRPYRKPLPPAPAPAERMARKLEERQKAKEQRQAKKVVTRYAGLVYDYGTIDEDKRERVQDAALKIRQHERRAMQDLVAIGQELIVVRDLLPRGEFVKWIGEEFGWSNGSAYDFINMALRADHFSKFGNLGISNARLLSAPSVSDEVIAAVIEATQAAGKPLPIKDVRAIRDTLQPRQPKRLRGPQDWPQDEPQLPSIDAEYTVLPKDEFIFPSRAMTPDKIAPIIGRELGRKLQDALVHRIMKALLTPDEHDELLIALTRALGEE